MSVSSISILHARKISALINANPHFSPIWGLSPVEEMASKFVHATSCTHDVIVLSMGKTGYGKSTTVNKIIGFNAFKSSAVEACTESLQSVDFTLFSNTKENSLSFVDGPGFGENGKADALYRKMYEMAIPKAHVILYFLRADQRDLSVDYRLFDSIFDKKARERVVIVLNAIDKIEPVDRDASGALTNAQKQSLSHKLFHLRLRFPNISIFPVSATESYGMDALSDGIVAKLMRFFECQNCCST